MGTCSSLEVSHLLPHPLFYLLLRLLPHHQPAELAGRQAQRNATEDRDICHILSTKATALAVRPPTLLSEFATPLAAPAMAGPAAEETLDRPSCALEAYSDAEAAALEAAVEALCFAVSAVLAVVDSNRRAAMRLQGPDCRSMGRAREDDMIRGPEMCVEKR